MRFNRSESTPTTPHFTNRPQPPFAHSSNLIYGVVEDIFILLLVKCEVIIHFRYFLPTNYFPHQRVI